MSEAPSLSEAVTAPAEATKPEADVKNAETSPNDGQAEEAGEAEVATESFVQDVDAELEEMKRRLAQMEAESAGAKEASPTDQQQPDDANGVNGKGQQPGSNPNGSPSVVLGANNAAAPNAQNNGAQQRPAQVLPGQDSVADADARSIYVGNVDYSATGDQLSAHFQDCGTINRVTIMCNKSTGQPKGYAYIEFQDHNAAQNALILNESTFLGRPLKIVAKRTNIPAIYRGGYGRGRGRYTRGGRGFLRRPRRPRGRWAPY